MILWLAVGTLALAVAAVLLRPLLHRAPPLPEAAEYDIAVYRDQLAEIERERARGAIDPAAADAARTEVARRLLAADARRGEGPASAAPLRLTAVAVGLLVPASALGLYLWLGTPGLHGYPHAAQQAARAASNRAAADLAGLADQLAARMAAAPDNVEGWSLLGRTYMQLQRPADAAAAFARAAALAPQDAELAAGEGEARMLAAGGQVTPESQAAFERALAQRPDDPRARFYLGLGRFQNGDIRAAYDAWTALIADSPADAPWLSLVRERASEAAQQLGLDPAALPEPKPALGGPDDAAVAAAAAMTPEERTAMVEGMVARLAARLKEQPGDIEGWLRLARAYEVLGRHADMRDAMAQAAALAPRQVPVLLGYARAIRAAAGNAETPESLALMQRVLEIDPDNLEALWLAGRGAAAAGDRDAARRLFDRALVQLPEGSPERQQLQDERARLDGQ
ncbi:MAG: c-type cytochrome biogenesis protein CcmI [Alphaproteobacteria bacterium]